MKEFWSGRIRSLTPYTPGEQPKERKFIKLNTNENPYPPSPKVVEAVQKGVDERLKLYPDPDASKLVSALAQSYGVKESQVFVGNGSDEVLAFAFQAFFEEGGTVLFPDITYSFYPVYCNMFGIHYRTVPLQDDFTIPVEKMLGDNDGVVITNPNALAGMRVGFAFGSENLIQGLNCVKNSINSYTIDQLAILAGVAAVEDGDYFAQRCAQVAATRDRTSETLRELGFTVLPSKSNFIFITHPERPARKLFADLREAGILVRYFDLPRIDNFLRVTIGSEEEMEKFCATMKRFVENVL